MAGAETFLARLLRRAQFARELHPRDGNPICHCVLRPSAASGEMEAAGVEFESLKIGGKANLLAVHRLRTAARSFRANVLHSHLSSASWWCGWLEQLGGPPSIGHVHGFTSTLWHRRQSHLIACSAAVKKHLVDNNIAPERISVMHYPVDAADMRPCRASLSVREEYGATARTPIVGTFGHLSAKKGYRELVQAAKFVLECMPEVQFWCFGDGPLRTELEQTARALGIADRFKLLGFRRDVPDLMQAVDLMCLPSHREPFGLVYIEAALAGKPVIGCNAGGVPEIVVHGETGLLVPPPCSSDASPAQTVHAANIFPLADALFTLLDNPAQAAAMGTRGRELAKERFGWTSYLDRLSEVYARVTAERRSEFWLRPLLPTSLASLYS